VVSDRRTQLLELEREIRVLHLSRECLTQRPAQTARRIDVPLVSGLEERRKERQTLNVVPMGVADRTWPLTGFPVAASAWPREKDPVPMSSTTSVPCDDWTAVHDVLPPYLIVRGPGTGIDPRVPKNLTSMGTLGLRKSLTNLGHNNYTMPVRIPICPRFSPETGAAVRLNPCRRRWPWNFPLRSPVHHPGKARSALLWR
jgi:hypothetical protein